MLRNQMRLCAALLCCVLLCSCDGIVLGGKNVEELLRAPRPSQRQSAVQTALNAYLGETLQLKYPRGGAEPDPVIFADLDGDGAEEGRSAVHRRKQGARTCIFRCWSRTAAAAGASPTR